MKIFIAGGTGAIGRPLIAELLAQGHAVVALTRSPLRPMLNDDRTACCKIVHNGRRGRKCSLSRLNPESLMTIGRFSPGSRVVSAQEFEPHQTWAHALQNCPQVTH